MTHTKVTNGVYKHMFDAPIPVKAGIDIVTGKSTYKNYVGYQTVGISPNVVFDALHKNHNNPVNTNVLVFCEDGTNETMTFDRMKTLLNL